MNAEQLYLRAVRVLFGAAERPVTFAAALRYAALTARRLGKTREGRDYLMALQIATEDAKRIYMAKRSNDMSEGKSNAARHGLKEDDIVGILDSDYLGRVWRITHIGTGVFAGKCVVLVNGEGLWIDADLLCKISRRGCFRRTKPRRKTANAKHEANGGTSGAIRHGDPRLDPGYYAPTVGAGAGSEPQPESTKAEPKFKAGDRVHVNDAPYGADKIGFHSIYRGTDGEVGAIYEPGYYLVRTSLGVGLYHESDLTLWTSPEENPVPEVGDYVRITRAWTSDDVHASYAAAMFPRDETIGKVGRYAGDWDKREPVCMVLFPDGNDYMYPRAVVEKVSGPDDTWKGKLDAYWPSEQAVPAPAEPSPATESAPEPEKPKFKPFDRVLVRDTNQLEWRCDIFSHMGKNWPYVCIGGFYHQCIPYEGNEALVGTTNDPEKG